MQFTMLKRSRLKRRAPRRKPGDVDRAYVAWIKTQPCVACLSLVGFLTDAQIEKLVKSSPLRRVQQTPTEAHHAGDHGYAQRPPDRTCIPLCAGHHREGDTAIHGPLGKNFWAHHGIDRDALIARLNQEYDALH